MSAYSVSIRGKLHRWARRCEFCSKLWGSGTRRPIFWPECRSRWGCWQFAGIIASKMPPSSCRITPMQLGTFYLFFCRKCASSLISRAPPCSIHSQLECWGWVLILHWGWSMLPILAAALEACTFGDSRWLAFSLITDWPEEEEVVKFPLVLEAGASWQVLVVAEALDWKQAADWSSGEEV